MESIREKFWLYFVKSDDQSQIPVTSIANNGDRSEQGNLKPKNLAKSRQIRITILSKIFCLPLHVKIILSLIPPPQIRKDFFEWKMSPYILLFLILTEFIFSLITALIWERQFRYCQGELTFPFSVEKLLMKFEVLEVLLSIYLIWNELSINLAIPGGADPMDSTRTNIRNCPGFKPHRLRCNEFCLRIKPSTDVISDDHSNRLISALVIQHWRCTLGSEVRNNGYQYWEPLACKNLAKSEVDDDELLDHLHHGRALHLRVKILLQI